MKKEEMDTLSGKDIAVYALYLLKGWQMRIHTEDIALKCYQLAPSKFSWVKYPKYPDIAPTRFALEAAKKPENGALVKGESERKRTTKSIGGWMLTTKGTRWIKANKLRIELYLGKHTPIGDRLSRDRRLKELFKSTAFNKFRSYGEKAEISHADFAESLVCTVNTRAEVLNDRLDLLSSIAEELERKEIKNYIDFCRKRFVLILGSQVGDKNDKT